MSAATIVSALPMRSAHGRPAAPGSSFPLVAVLCAAARSHAAAAGVALALARGGAGCGIATVAGGGGGAALVPSPATRRAAVRVRERGLAAIGTGRLVWLPDRRGSLIEDDAAAHAAAMGAELARAATTADAPGAVGLPLARTGALDRVLAWHDAIVVVGEPDAPEGIVEQAVASLAALGRPVVAMAPPARFAAALAVAGVRAPAEAVHAVATLGLGEGRCGG